MNITFLLEVRNSFRQLSDLLKSLNVPFKISVNSVCSKT